MTAFVKPAIALDARPALPLRARFVSLACGAALASAFACGPADAAPCSDWNAYRTFVSRFVTADGRVVDYSTPTQQTTSEGQSYAMFFALVANDRPTFDRLLGWTRRNLAAGQFDPDNLRLPSWQWGKRPDGTWAVIDPNSASDSDLWIAYDLLQAGRLWNAPAYTALGKALAVQIARREVSDLAGLGPMLLPGPQGFVEGGVTRLNPGYLPLPVLRALAHEQHDGPWSAIAQSALKLVTATAPHGFAPDWAAWRLGQFVVDPKAGDVGSYDAIRVYLWAGLAAPADPLAKPWLNAVRGMSERVAQAGVPPEKVAATTGIGTGEGPLSYWGALAPYFAALGETKSLALARSHLEALADGMPGREPVYYDRVLGLFGTGAIEGRYHFDADGQLVPSWSGACM
ncbi:MAG: cellulase [Paraburkholderia sp.]|nr:cellulase [Paraburkholderia sp.]